MKIFVKIDNRYEEIELYSNERISTTFTFDDLESPSNVVSDYSESFNVPRSARNNKIFNEFVQLDNKLTTFQPNEFIGCIITNNSGQPILEGNCYIKKINKNDYNIQISGTLFSIFKKIKELDYNKPLRKHKNRTGFVDNPYPNVLTASNVVYSWINSIKNGTILYPMPMEVTYTDRYLEDYVGWAMCNDDEYKDFKSDKWITHNVFNSPYGGLFDKMFINSNMQITNLISDGQFVMPTIEGGHFVAGKAYSIYAKYNKTTMKEEPLDLSGTEMAMNEYRSYYQHPYLKLKKWFEFINEELQTETGYSIDIQDGLIEDEAIYLLDSFYGGDKNDVKNVESIPMQITRSQDVIMWYYFNRMRSNLNVNILPYLTAEHKNLSVAPGDTDEIKIGITLSIIDEIGRTGSSYVGDMNPLLVNIETKGQPAKYCIIPRQKDEKKENDPIITDYYGDLGYKLQYVEYEYMNDIKFEVTTKISGITENNKESLNNYDLKVNIQLANLERPIWWQGYDVGTIEDGTKFGIKFEDISCTRITRESTRSGKPITIENLLKGKNMFDVMIGFTKLKHAIWIVDDVNRKIILKKCEDYITDVFFNGGVKDITNNVDFSSIEQFPISWNSENVRMKHKCPKVIEDYDTKIIDTPNHINISQEPVDVFSKDQNVLVMSQKTGRVFTNIEEEVIVQSPYILPYVQEDNDYTYGYANWSNTDQHKFISPKRVMSVYASNSTAGFWITDDSKVELDNDLYCWHSETLNGITSDLQGMGLMSDENRVLYYNQGSSYSIPTTSLFYYNRALITSRRPYITDYNLDGDSLLYSRPEYYLYDRIDDYRTSFVFDKYSGYINQIYNQNNRKIELTAKISYNDWKSIKRNPFVMLEDNLFMVCSIQYWNDKDSLAKVVLRKVSNVYDIVDKTKNPFNDTFVVEIRGGENCYTREFSGSYKSGSRVHIVCVPDEGYRFVGWYNKYGKLVSVYSNWSFEVSDNITLIPVVEKIPDNYAIWKIEAENAFILCDWGTDSRLPKGTDIVASVMPLDGYNFVHWIDLDSGQIFSTENNINVTLDRDYHLKAVVTNGTLKRDIETYYKKIQLNIF